MLVLEQLVEFGLNQVVPETLTHGKTKYCIGYQSLLQVKKTSDSP